MIVGWFPLHPTPPPILPLILNPRGHNLLVITLYLGENVVAYTTIDLELQSTWIEQKDRPNSQHKPREYFFHKTIKIRL